jgi:hypothetical protein
VVGPELSVLEYPSLRCNLHWFEGFLHEVLDCVRSPGRLQCRVLQGRLSRAPAATVAIFSAPGLSSVAVAAWGGPCANSAALAGVLDEPLMSFIEIAALDEWRKALVELRAVMNAHFDGRPNTSLFLTACHRGVALRFKEAGAQDPPEAPNARLANFLKECPETLEPAASYLSPDGSNGLLCFSEVPDSPLLEASVSKHLQAAEPPAPWTVLAGSALRAYPMRDGENAVPFVRSRGA